MFIQFLLVVVLVVAAVAQQPSANCSFIRAEALSVALGNIADEIDVISYIKVIDDKSRLNKEKYHELWSGTRADQGVTLRLLQTQSQEEEQAVQVVPVMNDGQIDFSVILPAGMSLSDTEAKDLITKTSESFSKVNAQQCISPAVAIYEKDNKELLSSYQYDPKFPGWFGCFLCATSLAFTVPVVMNLAIGEVFTIWCVKQGGSESDCEEKSMTVVLALEMPIIFIGGAIVYKECFASRDCTPSSSPVHVPELLREMGQVQLDTVTPEIAALDKLEEELAV